MKINYLVKIISRDSAAQESEVEAVTIVSESLLTEVVRRANAANCAMYVLRSRRSTNFPREFALQSPLQEQILHVNTCMSKPRTTDIKYFNRFFSL